MMYDVYACMYVLNSTIFSNFEILSVFSMIAQSEFNKNTDKLVYLEALLYEPCRRKRTHSLGFPRKRLL